VPRVTRIVRWKTGSAPVPTTDRLAPEKPLEIRVDSRPVIVKMRNSTPSRVITRRSASTPASRASLDDEGPLVSGVVAMEWWMGAGG